MSRISRRADLAGLAAETVEGRQFQDIGVLDIGDAVIGALVQQDFGHGASLGTVLAKDLALADLAIVDDPRKSSWTVVRVRSAWCSARHNEAG